ncbi:hypothetical protein FRC20_010030 [Serendipita sp. 405]|nr:hypothetical protein FRC20_010030 [Serendipita sp. 405]
MSTPPTSTSDAMDDVLPTNRHSGETTAIDTPVPTTLEIWCIVLGEKVPFPVTIARNQSVGHLKEAIHSKKKTLQFTDANLLTLYELNLPRSKDLPETLENMKLDATQALDAMDDLSDVFPNTLKKKTVHVLVQPPKSGKCASSNPVFASFRTWLTKTFPLPFKLAHSVRFSRLGHLVTIMIIAYPYRSDPTPVRSGYLRFRLVIVLLIHLHLLSLTRPFLAITPLCGRKRIDILDAASVRDPFSIPHT